MLTPEHFSAMHNRCITSLKAEKYVVTGHNLHYAFTYLKHTYTPQRSFIFNFFDALLIVENYVYLIDKSDEPKPTFALIVSLKGLWFLHCGKVLKDDFLSKYNFNYS